MSNFIGLDACRMGWCGVGQEKGQLFWGCYQSLEALCKDHPDLQRILIDIPIGLSSKNFTRTVDTKARTHLNKRKSSIFTPPCREALYAKNYQEALRINRQITDKGLSIQAYNIGIKIEAVDKWFAQNHQNIKIYEAHPELCFKSCNNKQDLVHSKHNKLGLEERQNLVFTLDNNLKPIYKNFLNNYKRQDVKPDDILDAMILYLTAKQKSLKGVSDNNNIDETGKPVRIVYG